LSSLGINTFFTGSNANTIGVNSDVTNNPSLFATAQGGGPSDGSNALALTQFASNSLSGLNNSSVDGYYDTMTSNLANNASATTTLTNSLNDYSQSLQNQEQQYSGVSLDQQAIQIMQYQESYQASAKLISTIDQLFQTLVQI
jgi:flagellar hook-associated protein 1